MNVSVENRQQLAALASHLAQQRDAILHAWRNAVDNDPEMKTASTVTRAQFNDHIPQVLDAFARELHGDEGTTAGPRAEEQQGAAEHGLQRWQLGYDQRETMREWGHLHLCVFDVITRYAESQSKLDPGVIAYAQRALVRLCNAGVCESAARFTWFQRAEAASRVRELEQAVAQVTALDRQRAEAWREAAHDLRGSVSVISTAAAVLNRDGVPEVARSQVSKILRKGVVSLHDLLSDLMSLARLEAGHDQRNVAPFDAAHLLKEFCDSMRPIASERNLFLKYEGPESLPVEGDGPKVRRIAQNLLLNAFHVVESGGISVSWQDGAPGSGQWMLIVQDTGPGFSKEAAPLIERALKHATEEAHEVAKGAGVETPAPLDSQSPPRVSRDVHGEGIGLSIVKRLCELLDASVELDSDAGKGSTFRVLFPRAYPR